MTVKYDAFFDWLKGQQGIPTNLGIDQYAYPPKDGSRSSDSDIKSSRYRFGLAITKTQYKGLDYLLKHDLIVGQASPIENENTGIFFGACYNTPKQMEDFSMFQVFDPKDCQVSEGCILPIVARLTRQKTVWNVEYCPAAAKYGIK